MTKASATLATALVLLQGFARLTAQNTVLAEIPIELARNKTIIPVTVGNSGTLRMVLDSGMDYDGILLFDTTKVPLTQFSHLVEVQIGGAGAGGASRALSDDAATFFVGARRFAQQRVTILTSGIYKGFPTDGIIGYSLLGHYAVELDYDRSRMILYDPATFAPRALSRAFLTRAGWSSRG